MTMSVLMQIRVSFSEGKAFGVDGNSVETLKSIPWIHGKCSAEDQKNF